jgi:hypothetical protein
MWEVIPYRKDHHHGYICGVKMQESNDTCSDMMAAAIVVVIAMLSLVYAFLAKQNSIL